MSTWAPPTARFFLVVMVIAVGCRTYAADAPAPPNTAIIPVPKLEQDSYDWYARHDAILAAQSQLKPEVVMIGDSITHFWSGTPQANLQNGPHAWRQLFGPHAVLNMGFGWDRTQNVLWRLAHGEFSGIAPRYVVLNIGTNNFSATKNARANTPAEVAAAIDLICTRLHERAPDSRLIIMGVFPRGERPTDPVRAEIIALNKLLPAVAKSHNAVFLDIGPQFLNADGTLPKTLMADFCHPTEQGYAVWANALKPSWRPSARARRRRSSLLRGTTCSKALRPLPTGTRIAPS